MFRKFVEKVEDLNDKKRITFRFDEYIDDQRTSRPSIITSPLVVERQVTDDLIEKRAEAERRKLEAIHNNNAFTYVKDDEIQDPVEPTPEPPTPEQEARILYADNLTEFKRRFEAVRLGIIFRPAPEQSPTPEWTDYQNRLTWLRDNYLDSYANLFE